MSEPDDSLDPSAKNLATTRDFICNCLKMRSFAERPFEGLRWTYFFEDLRDEVHTAGIEMRDASIASICDTMNALPPAAMRRLQAAFLVYDTPFESENEEAVDYHLQPLDTATAMRMRQRRHEVQAAEANAAKQADDKKKATARDPDLDAQYWHCPNARLSTEPADFLHWIKDQTPDTWHVVVETGTMTATTETM